MSDIANKVETLMEAMPYLQKYQGKIIVIKYGGNAMINEELKDAVMHDVVLLKLLGMKPVLSHGGGPGINKMLEKLDIPVEFIEGLRYTSADIMRVVEMVLVGQVNTELVALSTSSAARRSVFPASAVTSITATSVTRSTATWATSTMSIPSPSSPCSTRATSPSSPPLAPTVRATLSTSTAIPPRASSLPRWALKSS